MKIKLGKDKENLDLQYKTGYLLARYESMNAAIEVVAAAEREANPGFFAQAEEAAAALKRAAEKAAALPAAEKLALLQELADAMARTDATTAVPALLRREGKAVERAVAAYKATLKDSKATDEDKALADAAAQKAQRRYIALKEQNKMEEDKKAAALL